MVNAPSVSVLSFDADERNRALAGTIQQRAKGLAGIASNRTAIVASRAPTSVCDTCAASMHAGAAVRPSDLSCLSGAVVAGPIDSLKNMLERVAPPVGTLGYCNSDAAVQHYAAKFPADVIETDSNQGAIVSFATAAAGCFALSARFTGLFIKAEAPACAAELQLRAQLEAERLSDQLEPGNDTDVVFSFVRGRNSSSSPGGSGDSAPALSQTAQVVFITLLALVALAAMALVVLWASRRLTRRRRSPPARPAPAPRRTTKYATIIYYRL